MPPARRRQIPEAPHLVKLSELARESGVPAATIKHYVREGLVPGPAAAGRNVAYYERSLTGRIRRIKELQRSRFLPLKVIREVLDGEALPSSDDTVGAAIARVLSDRPGTESRTGEELRAAGMPPGELSWLVGLGLVTPQDGERFAGDDLELLRVLGAARRAGITAEMLPVTVLGEYAEAMQRLVRAELRLFRQGVVSRAPVGSDLGMLAEAATSLSERLVVLLRRKLLLPTLAALVAEQTAQRPLPPETGAARRSRTSPRRKPS